MKTLPLILLLLFGLFTTSIAVDFDDLIKNPRAFDKKRITLVAMAEVGGDRFYLYRPPKPDWSKAGNAREVYGILHIECPVYDRFNDKWVVVTGVVDASYRGLAGLNACGLFIYRVRPVRKPPPQVNGCNDSCLQTRFSDLLHNPKAFEHKCVCVNGYAHVIGDAFVIYETEGAAGKPDFKKGIFVAQKWNGPNYDHFNNHWIKIRGTVDMTQRGFDDHPCGIVLDRIESSPPQK